MTDFGDFFNYLRNSVNKEKIPVDEKQLSLLGNLSPEEWRGYKNQLPPSRSASLPWERPNWPGTPPFIPSEPKGISSEDLLKRKTSPNSTMDYWKQPAFGGRFGIKMPRDQFVTLMGVLGQSIAPNSFGGRLGANLAQLGGSMYGERMRREREEPMRSLNQRLKEMQIRRMEKEKYQGLGGGIIQDLETGEILDFSKTKSPTSWDVYLNASLEEGKSLTQTVEEYKALGKQSKQPKLVRNEQGIYVEAKPGVKGYTKPSASSKKTYRSNLMIAAQIAKVDPKKVDTGTLTPEEADKIADVYRQKFGSQGLIQMLMSDPKETSSIRYDSEGNRIQ